MSKKLNIPKSGSEIQAWLDLAFDEKNPNQLEKLSKDQLSVYVTHHNLPNGTKSSPKMMIVYIKMHLAGNSPGIQAMFPGENFADFKVARIKKELAKCGILPEGTFAELSMKLLEQDKFKNAIKQKGGASDNTKQENGNSSNQQGQTVIDGVVIAKEVLKLGEAGDYEAILSLLGTKITRDSTVGQMRKAYLKLSLLIHPDKLQHYPDAKKSFQELVDAYERLSRPEDFEKKNCANNTKNKTTLKRSNQGCTVTQVYCPRCKHEWNTPLDGNPEFSYTLFMTGLKNYHCSTCLLDFGCISAIHKCPHCRKGFEYHPDDFHRKVKCGNDNCKHDFGFYEHYIQDRVMKEVREQIMFDLEQRMKRLEAKKRRAKSQSRRNQQSSEEIKQQEEQAFLIGLKDLCPRCGIDLHELPDDVDQFRHLRECTDEYKHKEYEKKKKQEQIQKEKKQEILEKQDNIQNEAVFNAFGGASTMLWLLSEEQLKKQCQISNVDDTGSKEDMIARLAQARKGQKALGGGDVQAPRNLSAQTQEQLRGVMLAHGLNPDKYKSKKDMINAIERIQIGLDKAPQPKMLTDDPNKKMEEEKNSDDSDSVDGDGEESDYELPSDNEKNYTEKITNIRNMKYAENNEPIETIKKKKKLVKLNKKSN